MPRIKWIDDTDAEGQLGELFQAARAVYVSCVPRDYVPHILQTMSHRPDFLAAIMDASRMHFSDGALTRAQHEMIASYVSALNHCHY